MPSPHAALSFSLDLGRRNVHSRTVVYHTHITAAQRSRVSALASPICKRSTQNTRKRRGRPRTDEEEGRLLCVFRRPPKGTGQLICYSLESPFALLLDWSRAKPTRFIGGPRAYSICRYTNKQLPLLSLALSFVFFLFPFLSPRFISFSSPRSSDIGGAAVRPSRAGRGWASRISTPEEDPFVTANRKGAQPEMTLLPYEMPHVVLQRPTLKKKKN